MLEPVTQPGEPHVEVVEENPGAYSWRIVFRDKDTGAELGAPIYGDTFYPDPEQARHAADVAVTQWRAGSLVIPPPDSTG